MDLEGKVAIVTGAASGIGRATAELLRARGAKIIAHDIDEKRLAEAFVEDETTARFVGDAASERAAGDVVALAKSRFGRLDVLVNNAARIVYKNTVDMTLADWNSILDVTSTGVFLHTREALKAMIPQRSGAIVNIGSYACYQTFPGISAYAAAKGALAQITRTTALEAIEHGIRVNAVGSGDVVTNLLDTFRDDGRAFLADHGKLAPIRRAGRPVEIAEVVAFLASDRASFLVGSIVMADGGMSVVIQRSPDRGRGSLASMTAPELTTAAGFERFLEGTVLAEGRGPAWRQLPTQLVRRPRVQPAIVVPAVAEAQIVWITRGRALVEERDEGSGWRGKEAVAGDFFLSASATPYELRWRADGEEPFEVLMVYVDLGLLRRAANEHGDPPSFALRDVSGARDTTLSMVLELVRQELLASRPSALVIDGLASALVVHLVRAHGSDEGRGAARIQLAVLKLRRAVAHMESRIADELDLTALARHVGLSPSHFSRAFRRSTGLTPSQYLTRLRVNRGKDLLRETSRSVIEIALAVGYASHSHFTQAFRRQVGVTPTEYRSR